MFPKQQAHIVVVASFLMFSTSLLAGEWEIEAELSSSTGYVRTKNPDMGSITDPALPRQSEYWIALAPGINISGDGARSNLLLDYQVQYAYRYNDNFVANNDPDSDSVKDDDFLRQEFLLQIDNELLRNLLYFDLLTTFDQALIDPQASVDSPLGLSEEDLTDRLTYTVSPYLQHRFNGGSIAELRYNYNVIENDFIRLFDTYNDQISAQIDTREQRDRFFWSINYSYDDVKRERNREYVVENEAPSTEIPSVYDQVISLAEAELTLGYLLQDNFILTVAVGDEENEVTNTAIDRLFVQRDEELNNQFAGTFWSVGFEWNASPFTSLEVSSGERFYGDTYLFRLSHERDNRNLSLSYEEDLLVSFQTELPDPSNINPFDPVSRRSDVFIEKTAELNYIEAFNNADLSISIKNTKRDYGNALINSRNPNMNGLAQEDSELLEHIEEVIGVELELNLELGSFTTLSFSVDVGEILQESKTERLSTGEIVTTFSPAESNVIRDYSITYTWMFSRDLQMVGSITDQSIDSKVSENEFDEKVFEFGLRMLF